MLSKILLTVLLFLIFLSVIFFVKPPESWAVASVWQILIFFIPLLLFLTSLVNLFLQFLPKSFIASLGIMVILVFQASGLLNIISSIVIIAITLAFLKFFPKFKYKLKIPFLKRGLTTEAKIPKLTRIGDKKHG